MKKILLKIVMSILPMLIDKLIDEIKKEDDEKSKSLFDEIVKKIVPLIWVGLRPYFEEYINSVTNSVAKHNYLVLEKYKSELKKEVMEEKNGKIQKQEKDEKKKT